MNTSFSSSGSDEEFNARPVKPIKKRQRFNQTYRRDAADICNFVEEGDLAPAMPCLIEIMAYGAENEIANDDPARYSRIERQDTNFQMQALLLHSHQQTLDVWAVAEHIPQRWQKVNMHMLHAYQESFDLVNARLKIFAAPQSHLLEGGQLNWRELKDVKYPDKQITSEFGGPPQMKPLD